MNIKSRLNFLENKEQKEIDEIHQIGNQFKIDRIFNFLNNKLKSDHPFRPYIKIMVSDNLLEYNLLSSFVHGGPYAERYNFLKHDIEKLEFLPIHSANTSIRFLLQVLSIENPEYEEIFLKQEKLNSK